MGGERFDQASPECYLFGDNLDLNWLGSKPIAVRKLLSLPNLKLKFVLLSISVLSVSIFTTQKHRADENSQKSRKRKERVCQVREVRW